VHQKNRTRLVWVVLAALALMAASLTLLYRGYQAELEVHRAGAMARGRTMLDALAAGIQAQTRMGRYRSERLDTIFDALAECPGTRGISDDWLQGWAGRA